jgi:hypothetical protein
MTLATALAGAPRLARAQSPAPRDATARVTLPVPESALEAPYPAGATGDARVVLELALTKEGAVREAKVLTGPEPFARAARAAAGSFRFKPATKGGAPVAARVRVEIVFVAPEAPREPTVAEPKPASPVPGRAAPVAPVAPKAIEVTAQGAREDPPGATSLGRAEVRLLPGAFGDPFRAIEALPGVTPLASGVPFFFVRGAPPGNVGYYLDNVRVPLLYHIGLGPSVIHPAIVDRVELHPGGYPAQFGRFSGGIVTGTTKLPSDEPHGEALVRVVDAGAFVEAPFAEGRANAMASGRYSYTAGIFSLLAPSVKLDYWDYQTRFSVRPTRDDRVTVLSFGAYDFLGERDEETGVVDTLFQTEFHRVDVRWDHRLGSRGTVRQAFTLGYDRTGFAEGRATNGRLFGVRSLATVRATPEVLLRVGADGIYERFDVSLSSFADGVFGDLFPSRDDFSGAFFVDATIDVGDRLELVPGVRVDVYSSRGVADAAVDPRLAWKLRLTDWLRLSTAFGLASQPPGFVAPGPGFSVGALKGGLQRSAQLSAGLEAKLPLDVDAKVTFFHSGFFNMSDALGTAATDASESPTGFEEPTQRDLGSRLQDRWLGTSYGVELWVHRALTKRLGGFLSYTLSRSERAAGRLRFPSQFDRTHVLNAALGYDFGKGYKTGLRWVLYSGTPSAPASVPIPYPERLPPFFRFDWRAEKRWTVAKTGFVGVILELSNAFLQEEVIGVACGLGGCEEQRLGPVSIPSIGLEGGF